VEWTPGYREFAPPDRLRGCVACLWTGVTGPERAERTLVLPDGCVDLMWYQGAAALLAGPDTGPAPVTQARGTVLAGVRFRPGAAGAVLRLPLSETTDLRVDADEVPVLRGRLPSPDLPPGVALAALVELVSELAGEQPADPAMTRAALLLGRREASVAGVAGTLELSERQFLRRCEAAVGYGPATLRRVLRFRRFVSALDAGLPDGLAGAALAAGYADQPHLSRECGRLSGLSPQALARIRRPG
jgi:AraC-like DNA-binding protein